MKRPRFRLMMRHHNTVPSEAQQVQAHATQGLQDVEARWPHIRRLVTDLKESQGENHFSQTIDKAYRERFR